MSAPFRPPSPAAVVGVIAILVALSGASYAAVKANTIGAKQIKSNGVRAGEIQDGSVGSSELGDNSVTGSEVLNGSLGSGDVQDGSLSAAKFQDGSVGSADVAVDSLGTSEFVDESLGAADILNGSLSSSDVQNNSLKEGDVQDGSLAGADIAGLTGGDVAPGTFLGGNVTAQFTQAGTDLPDGASQSFNAFCPAGQTALGGGMRGDDTDLSETTSDPRVRRRARPTPNRPGRRHPLRLAHHRPEPDRGRYHRDSARGLGDLHRCAKLSSTSRQ